MKPVSKVRFRPLPEGKTLVVVQFADRTKTTNKFCTVERARRWGKTYMQHRLYRLEGRDD
jgi:hypothetical protein